MLAILYPQYVVLFKDTKLTTSVIAVILILTMINQFSSSAKRFCLHKHMYRNVINNIKLVKNEMVESYYTSSIEELRKK